jgi:phosphoribosylpyrophosphate synthetase
MAELRALKAEREKRIALALEDLANLLRKAELDRLITNHPNQNHDMALKKEANVTVYSPGDVGDGIASRFSAVVSLNAAQDAVIVTPDDTTAKRNKAMAITLATVDHVDFGSGKSEHMVSRSARLKAMDPPWCALQSPGQASSA